MIISTAPCSSKNSARWKPSGKVSRTVCWITRAPAKPPPAHKTPAHHRTHRAGHETEFKCSHHHGLRMDAALHHHQRVVFIRAELGSGQALGIFPAVLELERVNRQHFRTTLK